MVENQTWKKIIEPPQKKLRLNFKEIWSYRDLIGLFVKRDFVSLYKQTILGPLWAVIQPLLTTVVFSIVFGSLAKLTTSDVAGADLQMPSFLFYMIGTITWSYFATTVNATSNTFIANSSIMGKVYYPRMCSPIATSITNLISFFIQLVLFVIIATIYVIAGNADIHPSLYLLMVPLLIVQLMALSMGVGIIISALTTKYRDLKMLVSFGLSLWQYLSPIPYGLALVPEKYLWLYMLNPIAPVVTTMRYAFFGVGYFNLMYYLISIGITIIVFFVGLILFNRIERTFMDTV